MEWVVRYAPEFEPELEEFDEEVRLEIAAKSELLATYGPNLSRPYADTLKGSQFSNMKELRFRTAKGIWRVAFAFDPERQAILLVAGDKLGANQTQFYVNLIGKADQRFETHLKRLKKRGES